MEEFKDALEALSLDQQRIIAARFVGDVLDLTDDESLKHAQQIASRKDATPEELMAAYHSARHVAVKSGIHSEWELVDWHKQAEHFVAKACAESLAPAHHGVKWRHLAWNVAHHCRMARTCASIDHEQERPSLAKAEAALNKQIETQFELLRQFLAEN
jgi:hypothetical protein